MPILLSRNTVSFFRRALGLALAAGGLLGVAEGAPLRIAERRELFVDDAVLERLEGAEVRLGSPAPAGVAMTFEEPWEGRFCTFVTVLRDGGKFRMYYRGVGDGGAKSEITCYAESDDGIVWRKPKLGLVEIRGSKDNNVILDYTPQRYTHNFTPMIDDRPGVPAEERYKAVGGGMTTSAEAKATGAVRGLYRLVSADGIHWKVLPGRPLFTGYALDTQNCLVWLPEEQCFAVYLRVWSADTLGSKVTWKGMRLIARSTSKDFVNWTTPEVMTTGPGAPEHLYTNATHPYFRAPHLLISLPFRFAEERRLLSDEEMEKYQVHKTMYKGVSDAVLMTSRGGTAYDRTFMESFVRPGPARDNWAARSSIPALGVVPTGPGEMSMYLTCGYGTPHIRLERRTLRLDGFASLHGGYKEGSAVSKPLTLEGAVLRANFATSSIGYVKIAVLDESGRELPGYGAADAEELAGDEIDRAVTWKGGRNIAELKGRTVHLKFIVRDADLYSFGAFAK
ncbi:MAG TPA: hypothetical protein VGE76_03015 [Opitutaceae bacterium]